ncbi:MAG: hypothetical protein WB780_21265 [Candidatus Acidiferrales bacterium]
MARNRLIKLEFWRDEKIGALSHSARLLFISLWTFADDSGNGRSDARLLRSQAFPYDAHVTVDEVEQWLQEIASLDMAELYVIGGARYYSIKNFLRHQVINRPSKFRYPEPPKGAGNTPESLTEGSVSVKGVVTDESKRERERKRGKREGAVAPPKQKYFENRKITTDDVDPRFELVKELYFAEFQKRFSAVKPAFDGSDGSALKRLLRQQPDAKTEELIGWLRNAFESDDVPPLRPGFRMREFVTHVTKFTKGPLLKAGSRREVSRWENSDPGKFEKIVQ